MDEEQIKKLVGELLKDAVTQLDTAVRQYIDTNNTALKDSFTAQIAEATKQTKTSDDSSDTADNEEVALLKSQLKTLMDKDAEHTAKQVEASLDKQLTELASSSGVISPGLFCDAMRSRYRTGMKQDSTSTWVYQEGDSVRPLHELAKDFLSTQDGKTLLPPSGIQGTGTKETKTTTTPTTADGKPDAEAALAAAYGLA